MDHQANANPKSTKANFDFGDVPVKGPERDFWLDFGLEPAGEGTYRLPPSVIGFEVAEEHRPALMGFLKPLQGPPMVQIRPGVKWQALYRLESPAVWPLLERLVPDVVTVIAEGETIALPVARTEGVVAETVAELSELTAEEVGKLLMPEADPVLDRNPLLPFSLRGQSEKFRRLAIEATPLLGNVCLRGQVTIWYAGPNTGKTLVALSLALEAVREQRIAGANVYYINADDNGSGFATKLQLLDDVGGHTLAPGFRNLRTGDLVALLQQMADQDEARGILLIIDTVKKFASLMDKKESSTIAQAFRQVAMKGGTVLGLAHTTKNANTDGTPRYAGTSDLVDDADAVFTISPFKGPTETKEKVVEFRRVKARGDCAESAAYAFTAEQGVSYEELLASVRPVDPMQLNDFQRVETERSDADVIEIVKACLADGVNTKMVLIKEIARRSGVSERAAIRVIERYSGPDPARHRWRFVRRQHGAQVFELLAA